MREVLDLVLPLGGPVLVILAVAMWARYAMIRFGDDDEVARLRMPLLTTGALVVLLVLVVLLEEPPA